MYRHEPRIEVDYSLQRGMVAITNSACNLPSCEVGDEAVRSLRRRRVSKLGLRFEDDHVFSIDLILSERVRFHILTMLHY
jgi:hypothetical protein